MIKVIRMMKKVFFGIMIAVLLAALPASAKDMKKFKEKMENCGTRDRRDYLVGGFSDYPPFIWKTYERIDFSRVKSVYNGFVPYLLKDIFEELGIVHKKDVFFSSPEEMKKNFIRENIDLILLTQYEGDSIGYDYLFPAFFGNPIMVISPQERKIETVDPKAFSGKLAVFWKGENIKRLLTGVLPTDAKLVETQTMKEAFDKVLSGEADLLFASSYVFLAEAKRLNVFDKLYMYKEIFRAVKLFMAIPKSSQCRFLKEMIQAAVNKRLENKEEIRKKIFDYIDLWSGLDKQSGTDGDNKEGEKTSSVRSDAQPIIEEKPPAAQAVAQNVQTIRKQTESVPVTPAPSTDRPPVLSKKPVQWGRRSAP